MAHIVDFTITGLTGRQEPITEKLDRYINVFFGVNGSGKTSLLRILDSAMNGDSSRIAMVPFKTARVSIYSVSHSKIFVREIEKPLQVFRDTPMQTFVSDSTGDFVIGSEESTTIEFVSGGIQGNFEWTTTGLPKTATRRFAHTYLPTWRSFSTGTDLMPRREAGITVFDEGEEVYWDTMFARRLEFRWSQFTNQLLSEVQQIQGEGLASVLTGFLARPRGKVRLKDLDADDAYVRVNTFLERQGSPAMSETRRAFARRYAGDPRIRRVVSDINSIEERILETMASRDNLDKLILNMFSGNKTLKFENSGIKVETTDGEQISLASLSSGEKQALRIFIDTLMVEFNSLLIDEPELSLHIDWQKSLVQSMRQLNPEAQLILATHSPEIMADVDDNNIVRL